MIQRLALCAPGISGDHCPRAVKRKPADGGGRRFGGGSIPARKVELERAHDEVLAQASAPLAETGHFVADECAP